MKRNVKVLLIAAALIVLFGIVGRMDYEDALAQQRLYCDNVANGVWPDYEGSFKAECGGEEPPKFTQEILR